MKNSDVSSANSEAYGVTSVMIVNGSLPTVTLCSIEILHENSHLVYMMI